VKKNIADLIPKTIMAFLVLESRKIAQGELVEQIYKQGNLDTLVVEDPMIAANRENCKKVIHALKTAQSLLGEVTQYKI
jgi:dynamin 1-like protein